MRSRIAVVHSLLLCYCIVVSSINSDPHSQDSDQKWKEGNHPEENHSEQDTLDIHGHPRYAINIDGRADAILEMSERINLLITIGEQQLERLDSLEHRYTKLEKQTQEQTESIRGELREISGNDLDSQQLLNSVKAEIVLIKDHSIQMDNRISSIDNGSSCDNHSKSQPQIETENKLETLQLSVQDVSSSIGSVLDELSTIKRNITNVVNIISESLGQNKRLPTEKYLDSEIIGLKNTTIPETFNITKEWAEYEETLPADCWDVLQTGNKSSGIYKIQPSGTAYSFDVYCNMETHGGGWTVFQNRNLMNNSGGNFNRSWQEYKQGFGDLHGNFWLGLENVFQMTSNKLYKILIEVKDVRSTQLFALYDKFVIGSEIESYYMEKLGEYTGTAGDAMSYNAGRMFSTIDVDNDSDGHGNCASGGAGGWWYNWCSVCNPNGYHVYRNSITNRSGVYWYNYEVWDYYQLMETRMSLRPRS